MVLTSAQLLAGLIALARGAHAFYPDCNLGPLKDNIVCNPHANFRDRAKAVVNEFTLEELINNTVNDSPGVPRLGLPPYNWWSEGLHGVAARHGVNFSAVGDFSSATSFPQPILIGAAFDDDLIHQVAAIISTEGRAFNNNNRAGLDFWTPNINPFKDPRWGRGQETPGEDPYHISRYVYQLITGLQGGVGPDPYFKVVADCKHFAGYDLENWNGNDRKGFNAIITTQDLSEYYTPSFQSCVRDAKVGSVMCSYNAVNGVPSCANEYFLQDLVRDFYGLGNDQWITSDCDAVNNVFTPHNYTSSNVNASALSLKAGTDVDCGVTYSTSLGDAVNQNLVTKADLQQALYRQYASLIRLGYFDPPEMVSYRRYTWSDVNTKNAQNTAYMAAVEGIVLLKNDGILPLKKGIKNVLLVGEWGNATFQMQGNYQGIAPYLITPLNAFTSSGFNVTFVNGTLNSNDTSGFAASVAAAQAADVVFFAGGLDETVEKEGLDRLNITWPGVQLDWIQQLAGTGKPLVVLQMGAGQVDSSSLKNDSRVNALLWGGYPGQSGGQALVDIITGKQAPAGRLPITQYPAAYADQVPMTDMNLRPNATSGNPGRTYKWYTGTPVFEFGHGLHYTNFSVSWASGGPKKSYDIQQLVRAAKGKAHTDLGVLDTFKVNVHNTGKAASDYVALLFSNTTAGPSPAPLKQLVSYDRVKGVKAGQTKTASLEVTLGNIARVDEKGHRILYPGTYNLWLDITGQIKSSFKLTGKEEQIQTFPQPPADQQA